MFSVVAAGVAGAEVVAVVVDVAVAASTRAVKCKDVVDAVGFYLLIK